MARRSRPIFAAKPLLAPETAEDCRCHKFSVPFASWREILGLRGGRRLRRLNPGSAAASRPYLGFYQGVLPHQRGVSGPADFKIPLRKSAPSVDEECIHFGEESDFDTAWKGVFDFFLKINRVRCGALDRRR